MENLEELPWFLLISLFFVSWVSFFVLFFYKKNLIDHTLDRGVDLKKLETEVNKDSLVSSRRKKEILSTAKKNALNSLMDPVADARGMYMDSRAVEHLKAVVRVQLAEKDKPRFDKKINDYEENEIHRYGKAPDLTNTFSHIKKNMGLLTRCLEVRNIEMAIERLISQESSGYKWDNAMIDMLTNFQRKELEDKVKADAILAESVKQALLDEELDQMEHKHREAREIAHLIEFAKLKAALLNNIPLLDSLKAYDFFKKEPLPSLLTTRNQIQDLFKLHGRVGEKRFAVALEEIDHLKMEHSVAGYNWFEFSEAIAGLGGYL